MPIYEFGCPNGHAFDKRVSIEDRDNDVPCEECSSLAVRRFSLSPVIFRPEGYNLRPGDVGYWDVTDREDRASWKAGSV